MVQFDPSPSRRRGATGAGRRIYDMLRTQIADGTLPSGASAPSTRALAAELGVSRTTVTAAFEQLAAEGFLVTSTGRAARIATPLAAPAASAAGTHPHAGPEAALSRYGRRVAGMSTPTLPLAAPLRFDFLYGALASRDFPALAWRRAYQRELLYQQDNLYYAPPEGDAGLRRAL